MFRRTRREILADVGRGMFLTTLGTGVAADLGLGTAWADDEPGRLTFGDLDPLVGFIHETPADRLLPLVAEKLRTGTDLRRLVAAAALANARAFGGEDYVGFHTLMALPPAYHMAAEETDARKRPLAVMKVLFRNASRLGEVGGARAEVLLPVTAAGPASGEQIRDLARKADLTAAERAFAAVAAGTPAAALDGLMPMVDDATDVHRVVMVARSFELIDFVGRERAHTLLRQSVHYCVKAERNANYPAQFQELRALLPKLLDQYQLLTKAPGTRVPDDGWVGRFSDTIFRGSGTQAADAVAAALADGIAAEAVGEAISLAANQLVLRDEGRPPQWAQPNKPAGSCHGDSVGVHACDSVLAWRAIARAGGRRTSVSSLILAAYQVARDRGSRNEFLTWAPYPPDAREDLGQGFHGRNEFLTWAPYPRPEHADGVRGVPADALESLCNRPENGSNRLQDKALRLDHRFGRNLILYLGFRSIAQR
ncbi:MAG TPA: hypothetical protein VH092_05995, partial [Urbifossiella sp.]|nr:hypothetical protein [Urbifossiella sp.]